MYQKFQNEIVLFPYSSFLLSTHPFKISRVFLPFSSITYCVYVSNFIRLYLLMHKEFPRGGWRQEEKKKEREEEKGTRKGNVKTRITPRKLGNFDLHVSRPNNLDSSSSYLSLKKSSNSFIVISSYRITFPFIIS